MRKGPSENFEGLIEVSQIIRDGHPMKKKLKLSLKARESFTSTAPC